MGWREHGDGEGGDDRQGGGGGGRGCWWWRGKEESEPLMSKTFFCSAKGGLNFKIFLGGGEWGD